MELIPIATISALEDAAMEQGRANVARLDSNVDTVALQENFWKGLDLKIPAKAKLNRILRAADKYCAAILPYSACKNGCSYCCNIAVTLTTTEAELIGKHVGRKPTIPAHRVDIMANQKKYSGAPCPFLKQGRCSVYEVRPLACRIHFNMANSGELCDTNIRADIPMLNNELIDEAHFKAFRTEVWADMRDFFPAK